MKQSDARKIVAIIQAYFGADKFGEERCKVYELDLLELDAGMVQQAVLQSCRTSMWPPTIAEIRKRYTDAKLGPVMAGTEAWEEANRQARVVGRSYGPQDPYPRFSSPLVLRAVEAIHGDWNSFCNAPGDAAERARFIEHFELLADRERRDAVSGIPTPPRPLPARERPRMLPKPESAPTPHVVTKALPGVSQAPAKAHQATIIRPEYARPMTAAEIEGALEAAMKAL